jgi:hypothetical protein
MSVEKYRYKEDCHVERTENNTGQVAELYDSEGDMVWSFPANFTDEQIMDALEFANHAYKFGVGIGYERKAEEIRRILRGSN